MNIKKFIKEKLTIENVIKLVKIYFSLKSFEGQLVSGSFVLLGVGIFDIIALLLGLQNDDWVSYFAALMILVGTGIHIYKYRTNAKKEQQALSRKKTVVIESSGLSFSPNVALKSIFNPLIDGTIEVKLLDFDDKDKNGQALFTQENIDNLKRDIKNIKKYYPSNKENDVKYVYGGLTPVPYSFMIGNILTNQANINIYAWHRDDKKWSNLDKEDDNEKFIINGLDTLSDNANEVFLAISISYSADSFYKEKFSNMPIITMNMPNQDWNNYFSLKKLHRLGSDFGDVIKKLMQKNITKIHLTFAAPNDYVFYFGQMYHSRNMPEISIYQYEKDNDNDKFPYAINIKGDVFSLVQSVQ